MSSPPTSPFPPTSSCIFISPICSSTMSTDVRLNDDGYNTSIKLTFVGNGGKKMKKETSMRKEEEKSANSCPALACDDDEFDGDVNRLTLNDVDDDEFEELVVGDEWSSPELHNCSQHVFKNMHMIVTNMRFVVLRSTVRSLQR